MSWHLINQRRYGMSCSVTDRWIVGNTGLAHGFGWQTSRMSHCGLMRLEYATDGDRAEFKRRCFACSMSSGVNPAVRT